ncbi:hypothetical protein D3C71_1840090 [compost metagenome]
MCHDHHCYQQLYRLALSTTADSLIQRTPIDDFPVGIMVVFRSGVEEVIFRYWFIYLKNREAILKRRIDDSSVIYNLFDYQRWYLFNLWIF